MRRVARVEIIAGRVDGVGLDAEFARGGEDADGDLAAVEDAEALDRARWWSSCHGSQKV